MYDYEDDEDDVFGPPPSVAANNHSDIDFTKELNADQLAAVTAEDGPALVLAGAGSGKTRTLTYRVAYLLQNGISPEAILLLTFTNKASKQMLERVEELTGIGTHRFLGGTFHHVGGQVLRLFGDSIGLARSFTILDDGDSDSLLNEVIRELDPDFFKSKENPKAKPIKGLISFARNIDATYEEVVKGRYPSNTELCAKIESFAKVYQQTKLERGLADYDDLLVYWLEVMENNREAAVYYQQRFSHVLVDEYQDVNSLQARIVDKIASNHQVMAVGDDAQCIYTWRGADLDQIMSFPERHPGTKIFKIETNYRSSPEILELANGILENRAVESSYSKELKASRPHQDLPVLVPTMDTYQQADFVLSKVEQLYDQGVDYDQIAILYRAHFHAMELQIELSRRGMPFVITSGLRFFEQAHVKDLVAQLRFVINPKDRTAFYRFICLLPKIGEKTATKLLKLTEKQAEESGQNIFQAFSDPKVVLKVPADAKEDWVAVAGTLENIDTLAKSATPAQVVEGAIGGWYQDYLRRTYENWPRREEDLESLVDFASKHQNLAEMLSQLVLLSSESGDRVVRDGEKCLRLSTIHQSKGLEYPHVFIIGLADGLFPSKRAIDGESDLEEERRLFYVATTRAEKSLHMIYPMLSSQKGMPVRLMQSRFLKELPETKYELLNAHSSFGRGYSKSPGWNQYGSGGYGGGYGRRSY
ncbi:MAG: ATP-dependent helicase [Verrucomicrobiota bacterium]|nr:ATP-dependent helicase [Verrucomicrobiota bacterium]